MKVLIVGRGGREHAIAWKIAQSKQVHQVLVAPGNDGMKSVANCVAIDEHDHDALVAFAKKENVGLTIIGPEQPLADGIVNKFQEARLAVFGPTKEAAIIEGSKSFAKGFMQKYHIPTSASASFTSYEDARTYIEEKGAPIVIKADGLAAGKGVIVAMTLEEARDGLDNMMQKGKFTEASKKVVIEERLEGEEFSLMAFVHGEKVYPLAVSQDHKRAFDGDEGPNTGGMGAYSPVPQLPEEAVKQAFNDILQPTASGLVQENHSFTGILYAGLMQTPDGPRVIEFNARFGDPETQVVLPRMENDLVEVIQALFSGGEIHLRWSDHAIVGVVLASGGYPGPYQKGLPITGLENLDNETLIFHAGAKQQNNEWSTNSGRILLAARGAQTIQQAQRDVYREMEHFQCKGSFYRKDIGHYASVFTRKTYA